MGNYLCHRLESTAGAMCLDLIASAEVFGNSGGRAGFKQDDQEYRAGYSDPARDVIQMI